ncbi:MAG: prepilin-type N-terminal cleavage/methylation domain-containing protein [bacterium]
MRRIASRGVTLLELLVVMMILSLILTAAVKTWDVTLERGRFETTRRKLNQLSSVIVGDPDYVVSGNRVDFGYVGDMGDLPETLDDLVRPPIGVPDTGTWRGPYLRATFNEAPEGYRTDGWGDTIIYSRESLFVRSHGGRGLADRSRWLTRMFGYSHDQLLANVVSGRVLDVRGTPPDDTLWRTRPGYFRVWLRRPLRGLLQDNVLEFQARETNGQFTFLGIPQGNQAELFVRYYVVGPPLDSVEARKTVVVYPGTGARDIQVRLNVDWSAQ